MDSQTQSTMLINKMGKKEYFKKYYTNNKEKYNKNKKKFRYVITIGGTSHVFHKKSDIIDLIEKQLIAH